ncbi:MAG: hypothetical protein ACOYJB_05360 [Christensenellaceae bacterium]|jgi:hypothetical protein
MNVINSRQEYKNEPDRKKQKRRILVGVLLLAAAILGVVFYTIGLRGTQAGRMVAGDIFPGSGTAQTGHLPEMTEDAIRAQMQKTADETMFSFKINAQPVFESGNSEGTLRIENPAHNVYPFVVEIYLKETGEKIYDSSGILPNHHIDTAKLNVSLEKGTHEAAAYINAYDPNTQEYQGRSAVDLSIIIKN